MERETGLKPCPFCGGEARRVYKSGAATTHIECPVCHVQFPKSTMENRYDEAWNRRAYKELRLPEGVYGIEVSTGSQSVRVARKCSNVHGGSGFKCSECGAVADEQALDWGGEMELFRFCPNCGAEVDR